MPLCIPFSTLGGPCDPSRRTIWSTYWTNVSKYGDGVFQLQYHRSENFLVGLKQILRKKSKESRQQRGDLNVDQYRIILARPRYEDGETHGRCILNYPCVASSDSYEEIIKDFERLHKEFHQKCLQTEKNGGDALECVHKVCVISVVDGLFPRVPSSAPLSSSSMTREDFQRRLEDFNRVQSPNPENMNLLKGIERTEKASLEGALKGGIVDHRTPRAVLLQMVRTKKEILHHQALGELFVGEEKKEEKKGEKEEKEEKKNEETKVEMKEPPPPPPSAPDISVPPAPLLNGPIGGSPIIRRSGISADEVSDQKKSLRKAVITESSLRQQDPILQALLRIRQQIHPDEDED